MVNTKKCGFWRYNSRKVTDPSCFKNQAVSAQNMKPEHCSGVTGTGVLSRIQENQSFLCSKNLSSIRRGEELNQSSQIHGVQLPATYQLMSNAPLIDHIPISECSLAECLRISDCKMLFDTSLITFYQKISEGLCT